MTSGIRLLPCASLESREDGGALLLLTILYSACCHGNGHKMKLEAAVVNFAAAAAAAVAVGRARHVSRDTTSDTGCKKVVVTQCLSECLSVNQGVDRQLHQSLFKRKVQQQHPVPIVGNFHPNVQKLLSDGSRAHTKKSPLAMCSTAALQKRAPKVMVSRR